MNVTTRMAGTGREALEPMNEDKATAASGAQPWTSRRSGRRGAKQDRPKGGRFRLTLAGKIPGLAVISGIVLALAIGMINYTSASALLQKTTDQKFLALALARKTALSNYLNSIEQDLKSQAVNPAILGALTEFTTAWQELGTGQRGQLQKLYIKDNPHPTGKKENLDKAPDGSKYSAVHGRYHPWLRTFLRERGYYDIFLFDTKGNLVYTVFKELDYATNLNTGKWRDTELAQIYRAALKNPNPGKISFFDFKPYAPSAGAPASFIATALVDPNGTVIGVLAFQMPIDGINSVMQATAGMGRTGESFIVGSDRLMHSASRFYKTSTILKREVADETITRALAGKTVIASGRTLKGEEALIAAVPLDFGGARWAIVVQAAKSEVFAPLADLRNEALLTALILLLAVAVVAVLIARRTIIRPIVSMTAAMRWLAESDNEVDVPYLGRKDEIGEMAKSVQVFRENKVELVRHKNHLAGQTELLDSIVQHMGQGVIAFDADLKILASNPRVAKIVDAPESLFEVGRDFSEIVYQAAKRGDYGPGDPEAFVEKVLEQARGREPVQNERRTPDGRTIAVRFQPLPQGGAVISYSDITEEIATQDRLSRVQKMEAVGLLAGNIAHEFNNLLTSISGFTRMALKKLDDTARVEDCLAEVVTAADRAAEVTTQMLNFSGDRRATREVVEAGSLIQKLEKMLQMSVDSTIDLSVEVGSEKANIDVDPASLSQALLNLVINGCHAMPQGGKLTVGFHVTEADKPMAMSHGNTLDPGRYVGFTVTDTGIGIEAKILGKIFDPFFTRKDQGKGTGLGLSYVYGTISKAGGAIDVKSEPGQGTCFTLYLPVSDKEPATDKSDNDDVLVSKKIDATVLVAEDDPQLREYLRLGLEDAGLTVMTAPDGAAAEDLYNERADNIDLLITDVVMPRKSGVKLVESLQAVHPDLRAIFITGYAPELSDHLDGLNESATVLFKPFTPESLIEALRKKLAA